jgi:hypothetical protein
MRLRHVLPTTALIAAVLGASAPMAHAEADSIALSPTVTVTVHPFTIPSNTGCVRWPTDGTYNCDPVNLVFANRSPGQVRDLLRARGWTTFDLGSSQSLHFATATRYTQDVQVFRPAGRNTAGETLRYHVRLWSVRGLSATVTVGAVHHERRSGLFSDTIDADWETAETFVAGQLCGSAIPACATAALARQSAMQGGARWRGWANNAVATVFL